jgi:CRISPR-associated endonuclease Csn1
VIEEGIAVLKKEIWMNKEKGVRIKKVRIYSPSVTKPIHLKKHRDLSKHEYKQHIHVTNDENYVMAIYEDFVKDKLIRKFELINLLDAAQYYKVSNTDFRSENQLIPELIKYKNNDLPLRAKLLKGSIVLFYKDSPEEIEDMIQFKDNKGLAKRLYKITSFEPDGRIQFKLHNEARPDTQNDEGRKSIVDFENPHSRLRLSLSGINFLIEGKDFKLTDWGEIIKI